MYFKAKIARLINKSDFNTKRFRSVIVLNNNKSSIRVLRRKKYFLCRGMDCHANNDWAVKIFAAKTNSAFYIEKCTVFEKCTFLCENFRAIKLSNTYLSKLDSVRIQNPWLMDFKIG